MARGWRSCYGPCLLPEALIELKQNPWLMLKDSRHFSGLLYAVIVALLAVVFALDWLTPLRLAIWVLYMLPVVLCIWVDRPAMPLLTAAAASVLTIAGYFLAAPEADVLNFVLQVNRMIGILVMFVLATVALL
jgi:hypothetical protein